tara:strand:- start:60 stop:482 length:423 start_codon:yes stop_codon:yes gene_type:complete
MSISHGTIAFDTLTTSDQVKTGTEKSIDTSYLYNGSAKAWNRFDGTAITTIADSFNNGSATDNGTGDYTFTFTNNMSNTNYAPDAGGGRGTASTVDGRVQQADQITTSQFVFNMFAIDANGNSAYVEDTFGLTQVHGDLA